MMSEQHDQPECNLPTGLGKPAERALLRAGYDRLEQLSEISEADLKQLHGVGPKAIDRLRTALESQGLSFADETRTIEP